MIAVEEAVDRVLARATPLAAEQVPLLDALGGALATEIIADRQLPPWDNSAMDGYAGRAADIIAGEPLAISGIAAAGHVPPPLTPGSVVRVMTGAPLPAGADTVIMREDADDHGEEVRFRVAPRAGDHVRRAGSDIGLGARVLAPGATIGAGEIGLLAALGRSQIQLHRRPRVAIVSTGDELVDPDRAPAPGQIVGSNAWAIAAQCREAGALPTVLPIAPDQRGVIRERIEAALFADVVISSGGVSVGDFDFVKAALADAGVVEEFWKVAMKPGKPVVFGTRGRTLVFGLPGNPASSMVAFELFVRPALRRLAGHPESARPRATVELDEPYRHDGKRRHYVRAQVRRDGDQLRARLASRQGSGMLGSLVGVNALIDVPAESGQLAAGARLVAWLLGAV